MHDYLTIPDVPNEYWMTDEEEADASAALLNMAQRYVSPCGRLVCEWLDFDTASISIDGVLCLTTGTMSDAVRLGTAAIGR